MGLGSGKALFRLLHRDPEKSKEQAHVYVPPPPKPCKTDICEEHKSRPSPLVNLKNNSLDPISTLKAERKSNNKYDIKSMSDTELNQTPGTSNANLDLSENVTKTKQKDSILPMEVQSDDESKASCSVPNLVKEPKIQVVSSYISIK